MNYINLIPSIYLFEGKVVNKDTKEVIGTGNPVEIATVYDIMEQMNFLFLTFLQMTVNTKQILVP